MFLDFINFSKCTINTWQENVWMNLEVWMNCHLWKAEPLNLHLSLVIKTQLPDSGAYYLVQSRYPVKFAELRKNLKYNVGKTMILIHSETKRVTAYSHGFESIWDLYSWTDRNDARKSMCPGQMHQRS